jgi:hypothetical protein
MRAGKYAFNRPRLSKKQTGVLILAVILISGLYLTNRYFKSPAQGTIQYLSPRDSAGAVSESFKVLGSKYFSITYPGRYVSTPNSAAATDALEYWLLQTSIGSGAKDQSAIGITVKKVASGGLMEESSYKRYSSNKEFRLSDLQLGNNDIKYAAKVTPSSYEEVAYLQNGGILVIIVATSPNSAAPELKKEFREILTSYKWII